MKRIISAILVIVLMLCGIASAEEMTFQAFSDQLSDDTLQQLAAFLQSETVRRLNVSFDLPAGVYIVGDDIPAGSWTITVASKVTAEFIVYNSAEKKNAEYAFPDFDELLNASYGSDTIGKITLSPGNIVEISGKVHFDPFAGITLK